MASATRLFVSNLPKNTDHNALKDIFSSYGEITNFDLKSKPGVDNDTKIFAFVTISTTNFNVESCIKHFSNEEFQGHKLYVTRARESFLERLQREREQTQSEASKPDQTKSIPEIDFQNNTQNIHKRKLNDLNQFDNNDNKITRPRNKPENYDKCNKKTKISKTSEHFNGNLKYVNSFNTNSNVFLNDEKKMNADKKRLESIKKKRQEFSAMKNIIKTGLASIDKQLNKKVIFSDNEDSSIENSTSKSSIETKTKQKPSLFDDGGSDDEINFDIKKQFEGKKGQKVLDLQSKYKSDKRFVLDERFVEDESASEEDDGKEENVELGQANEKTKQLDILQNLLGVTIKTKSSDTSNKKPKLDMLRFDPSQPEHAKYFAPLNKLEPTKKNKNKVKEAKEEKPDQIGEKIEVSKEQFYKVTDDLKDAMNQPKEFSLRSLFARDVQNDDVEEHNDVISLQTKKKEKVKNPLQVTEKNPFVYDSSDSENEEETHKVEEENVKPEIIETKTFWRENLFFSNSDDRLKEGLLFFSNFQYNEFQKDRRELKSLMKKRIYNKERKNTMFQKKIGGRKKTIKQKFKKN